MTICYYCGRQGARGFETFRAEWYSRRYTAHRCANRNACERRQSATTASAKLNRVRAVIERREFDDLLGHRNYVPSIQLVRKIREILD